MNRDPQIKFIREKCIEANGEIVELKKGCVIKDFFKFYGTIINVEKYHEESNCYDVAFKTPELHIDRSPAKDHWEIIGRPIRLADVLLVLFESPASKLLKIKTIQQLYQSIGLHWVLTKDNLEDQSDETIAFIFNLLQ